ncbi:MAG: HEAT repeat domain-containing protein [Myxococcales bacterium]|nr:HEAT repeat domain-containing protein [Myxococcales bacterium]
MPALEAAAKGGSDAATAALARAGAPGVAALATLVKDDAHPDVADAAAFALATVPGSAASSALSALVTEPSPARVRRAVRAGVSRLARLGTVPSGISSAAKELRSAKDAEGRFLAALLPAVSSLSDAKDAVADADPLVRRAGIMALHAHPAADAAPVARKAIPLESDPELLRGLVGVAARGIDGTLAHDVPIPTSQLAVWLGEDPGPSAAVAAFVLGARGGPSANGHVARALEADDLSVRAAALLGLGLSADPGATQRLVARLLEPMAVEARRVAARALASRSDPAAATGLAMVSQLDADPEVRAAARRKGPRISPLLSGTEVGQTKVVGAGASVLVRPTMQRADGFPLALLPDPDGFVLAFRLPAGETRLTLHATTAPPSVPAPKAPLGVSPTPKGKP